ncbi:MAG: NADH-quinone oxidoreductase subunit C, partial [Anaerolineales bacterium]
MMNEPLISTTIDLEQKFPQTVKKDDRNGYEGFIVGPDHLLEVAQSIRDELGYDYLSSITGVDYLPDGKMEAVYHFYKSSGGPALVLKAQMDRDNAVVPTLVPLYPGAEFQEREAWDLLGIRFEGHPDLRRILMWEGFAGHPLRKDWHEAYYEEEGKPYKSRWPEGKVFRIEDKNPFHKNVDYPAGFDPDKWVPDDDSTLYTSVRK